MAKKMEAVSMLVHFGEIIWRTDRNYRQEPRNDADRLTRDLVPGWRLNVEPVLLHRPGSSGFTDEDVKAELAKRTKDWESAKADASRKYELKAFETLYVNPDTGKLWVPKFEGNSCYSRAAQYPRAMAYYFKVLDSVFDKKIATSDLKDIVPESPVLHVPGLIRTFSNERERYEAMIQENGANREGHVAPSTEDNLRVAKLWFADGCNESRMRQYFGATMAVKLYGICFLDAKFSELRLVDRILQKDETPGKIALKPIDFRKLQEFKQRYENLAKFRQKNSGAEPLSAEEVELYFTGAKDNPVERGKGMVRAAWETVRSNTSCKMLEDIAVAHLDNNSDGLKVYNTFSQQLNIVMELCRAGFDGKVLETLKSLKENILAEAKAKAEAERLAAEMARKQEEELLKAEAERLEAERIAAEKEEAERLEAERIAAEKTEAERIAAEKAEAEKGTIVTEEIPHGGKGAKSAKRVK